MAFFLAEQRRLELSINLLISFLQNPVSVEYLSRQLPDHPAFEGLIVEIDGGEIKRDLSLTCTFAKQARLQKIAIDRLGNEWAALAEMRDFPFVESRKRIGLGLRR